MHPPTFKYMLKDQWALNCIFFLSIASTLVHGDQPSNKQHHLGIANQIPSEANLRTLNNDTLLSLHRDLINIKSVSGNEYAIGEYLEHYLQTLNYTTERQYVDSRPTNDTKGAFPPRAKEKKSRRFNLLSSPSSSHQTRLLLTTHLDTVPPFYPYSKTANRISGRGSVDAKACIATQINALHSLLTSSLISPNAVSLLFVVGEEVGGNGMLAFNHLHLRYSSVIFGEPTKLKLASGHKGMLMLKVRARGKSAHSGYPWLGSSANEMLIPVLAALMKMDLPSSEKYGNSTVNIGRIEGGVAANVMAENAVADIGIRIAAGSPEAVEKLVVETIKGVDERIGVEFYGGRYGPVDLDTDVEGFETLTVNYGTDVPNMEGAHKKYLYGPGSILVAHSDHEHLAEEDLLEAVEGYKRIILHAARE